MMQVSVTQLSEFSFEILRACKGQKVKKKSGAFSPNAFSMKKKQTKTKKKQPNNKKKNKPIRGATPPIFSPTQARYT